MIYNISYDRTTESCIVSPDNARKGGNRRRTAHRWYYRSSPSHLRRARHYAAAMLYAAKEKNLNMFFITLTTQQSSTGMTDLDLAYSLRKYLKHKSLHGYLFVAERQKDTEDIHFHGFIITDVTRYSIEDELIRWCQLCNVAPHPAMYDIKRIHVNEGSKVVSYLSKYVGKASKHIDRSEIFACRPFFCSRNISRYYREYSNRIFVSATVDDSGLEYLMSGLRVLREFDYARLYEYSEIGLKKMFDMFSLTHKYHHSSNLLVRPQKKIPSVAQVIAQPPEVIRVGIGRPPHLPLCDIIEGFERDYQLSLLVL